MSGVGWTCSATAGSSCTASGSGNIADNVNVAAGGRVTYTARGTVIHGIEGPIVNSASVSAPPDVLDPVASNNTSSTSTEVTDVIFKDGFDPP